MSPALVNDFWALSYRNDMECPSEKRWSSPDPVPSYSINNLRSASSQLYVTHNGATISRGPRSKVDEPVHSGRGNKKKGKQKKRGNSSDYLRWQTARDYVDRYVLRCRYAARLERPSGGPPLKSS